MVGRNIDLFMDQNQLIGISARKVQRPNIGPKNRQSHPPRFIPHTVTQQECNVRKVGGVACGFKSLSLRGGGMGVSRDCVVKNNFYSIRNHALKISQ